MTDTAILTILCICQCTTWLFEYPQSHSCYYVCKCT
uniref:Membrane protein n=1 Tax=virus sp. ctCsQ3 TaxID=2826794 RepID=A0A8S5R7A2_9VIRU|nr:MAG TPA: membrane protein [virus sp. ctCsQ3]